MQRFRQEIFIHFILSIAFVHSLSLSGSLRQIKYPNVEHLTNVSIPTQVLNSETCDCGFTANACYRTPTGEKICDCWPKHSQKFGKCEECECGDDRHVHVCKFDEWGSKECECREGYSTMNGKCIKCECGEHSTGCTFDESGSILCRCQDRYAFRNGKCTVRCSGDGDCFNGRVCTREAFCDCPIGYSGERCEMLLPCEKLNSKCLSMAAFCEVRGSSASCVCPAGQSIGAGGVCAVSDNNTFLIGGIVFAAVLSAGLLIGGIYFVIYKRMCSPNNPYRLS